MEKLESLVMDLWHDYQCEQDCRVCRFFYLENPDDPWSDRCEIEDRLEELGLKP